MIIQAIVDNRSLELYGAIFAALTVLVFYGSTSDGQASFFGSWMQGRSEDRTLAPVVRQQPSYAQMADINSIYAGSTGIGSDALPVPSTDASTVHESAIMAITPPDDEYLDQVSGKRSGVVEYTVQEGDLLSFIASDYGVSQASIIWANNLKSADRLSQGQELRIPPISGVIHKAVRGDTAAGLAKKYGANVDRIIAYNSLPKDGSLQQGDEIVVPDGTISNPIIKAIVKSITGATTTNSFSHLPDLGDYFMKPTTGIITRGGAIHGRNGIDIANAYGTAIYAAASGTVTIADSVGYNGGYGKYIKIVHSNGTETLYGHASKLLVSVGQTVTRGDQIANMGSTGRSTGNHLHFEVHGAKNPLVK